MKGSCHSVDLVLTGMLNDSRKSTGRRAVAKRQTPRSWRKPSRAEGRFEGTRADKQK
jgi:hypothetical protein